MELYICFLQFRQERNGASYSAKAARRDSDRSEFFAIHTAMLFVDAQTRRARLIHAREPEGVVEKTFRHRKDIQERLLLTPDHRYELFRVVGVDVHRVYTFAKSQLGQPYATAEAWFNLWGCLSWACCCPLGMKYSDIETMREMQEDGLSAKEVVVPTKAWTCSELVLVGLCVGIPGLICQDPCTYAPGDLLALMKQNPVHFSIVDVSQLASKIGKKHTEEKGEPENGGTGEGGGRRRSQDEAMPLGGSDANHAVSSVQRRAVKVNTDVRV
jgi:hypothetical protein